MKQLVIISLLIVAIATAYTTPKSPVTSRKTFLKTCTSILTPTLTLTTLHNPANAFDGTGSNAYSGKSVTSKSDLKKSYTRRIIADMADFKSLGLAISRDETEGDAWINFFIPYQRREPDGAGRTYAALVDLVGNKELSGCGVLLAGTFAKAGKPSEGLPSVKKFNAMSKVFEPIKVAGQKGDISKAKDAYGKATAAVEAYLEAVELPPLSDAIYD